MSFLPSVIEAIGNTPLITLKTASAATGCTILGKAEFHNPGQSVKDRAALFLIRDAIAKGQIKPGGTIVEGTAGNTGIGLAMVGRALGLDCVIVIPNSQSREKKDALRQLGARLIEVPPAPYSNPNNFVRVSERTAQRMAKENPSGAFWANQFDNVANRQAHIETTGPEIWRDTEGRIDGFICAIGSGGTLAGTAMALKDKNPNVTIGCADPLGAAMYSWFTHGELKPSGSSIAEGIGQSRVTRNIEGAPVDVAFQIPDEEAIPVMFDLLDREGLCVGPSSGVNVAGAIRLARQLGPGHTIVTILCDYGFRYASRIYDPAFLRSKGLVVPPWLERPAEAVVDLIEGT